MCHTLSSSGHLHKIILWPQTLLSHSTWQDFPNPLGCSWDDHSSEKLFLLPHPKAVPAMLFFALAPYPFAFNTDQNWHFYTFIFTSLLAYLLVLWSLSLDRIYYLLLNSQCLTQNECLANMYLVVGWIYKQFELFFICTITRAVSINFEV
jgi:hypothetical protein